MVEINKKNKKLYVVEYWRNDGDWHSIGYDLNPAYTFYAKDDKEARQLALGYIKENEVENEDFWISKLAELKIERRKVRISNKKQGLSKLLGNPKGAIRKASFAPLKDRVVGAR